MPKTSFNVDSTFYIQTNLGGCSLVVKVTGHSKIYFFCMVSPIIGTRLFFVI